ncbi:MAG: HD-GYP domain-containing protein [Cellvibrionaceae bacterium]
MSAYAGHLASLQEKTQIVATEDIVSDKGVLIAKSGTEINQNACQKILKFKLLKPLEDSIFIANQLNAKAIYEQIIDMINKDAYLKALNSKAGSAKVLQSCCLRLQKYPLLLQKLTVLDMEITHVFHQSLLSGYLAYLCGYTQGLQQEKIEENFLAGLIHDIGLLHIDRYILTKKETLSAEEWRKIQSHPVIGYEILKRIDKFPTNVTRAVLEHHENLDGSGYPRAKTVHDLGNLGQLINLLDNVIAIYNKKFKPIRHSMRDVMPIMQMTMHSYLPNIVSIIFQVLKEVPPSQVGNSDCEILDDLIKHVQAQQIYINIIASKIQSTNHDINFTHNDKQIYAIQNIAINIMVIITSAGLNDPANIDWEEQLKNKENQQSLYAEVEDTRLMQDEIIYQLQTYQKSASVFINQNSEHEFVKKLNDTLDIFAKTPRPETPSTLKNYWSELTKGH